MIKLSKIVVLLLLVFILSFPGLSDEGMWLPHQMKDLNLEAKGLKMDPGDLYKKDGTGLMSAVVDLRGGTGEFVSARGLILTNHHVAYGAIQRASDKEHDYLKHGFLAGSMEEEIPAPGYIAGVLLGYDDVTDIVKKGLKPRMSPLQRYKAIEKIEKRLIAKEEKKAKDRRCVFRAMYSGNKYYLFKFKELRDVRVVYAPPRSIGNFGGEIDNWMWPRHTGDFTYLRAYVSKDNLGVDYSTENVPYQPKAYFKVSSQGVKEGDFTFLMGYPGRTYRNYTLAEMQTDMANMKDRLGLFKNIIAFLEKAGEGNRAVQIKYANLLRGINNALKNYLGKLEGLENAGVIARKKAFEKKFRQWMDQDPDRQKKYGTIFKKLEDFEKVKTTFMRKYNVLINYSGVRRAVGAAVPAQAYLVYRTALESQKPDMKREKAFQKRNLPNIKMSIKLAERRYDLEVDKAYFKLLVKRLLDYPVEQRPDTFKPLLEKGPEAIDAFIDNLYAKTIVANPRKRLELIQKTPAQLLRLNDPFIAFAADVEKEFKVLREKRKAISQEFDDLKKVYIAALLEMYNGKIASDANSTIRFSYGPVKGYKPKDAVVYTPFTTLTGVMEKETGEFPFEVPEKLKKLYKAKDFGRYADKELGDVVTCFLNTTNVTGGSSGSPVLNGSGELVGIAFDMTYESVIGDYYIIPEWQRVIQVDIRYVLFVTEKFAGALHLLKEMGL
jgi:hypothetical protein